MIILVNYISTGTAENDIVSLCGAVLLLQLEQSFRKRTRLRSRFDVLDKLRNFQCIKQRGSVSPFSQDLTIRSCKHYRTLPAKHDSPK